MSSLIILAGTFLVFWLLFIRPQQRRVREHHALVASVEAGDRVVTTSGVYGRITSVHDELVHLEIAPGVDIRVARAAIGRRVGDDVESGAPGSDNVNGDRDHDPGAGPVLD